MYFLVNVGFAPKFHVFSPQMARVEVAYVLANIFLSERWVRTKISRIFTANGSCGISIRIQQK
jgi:hypothetical protein